MNRGASRSASMELLRKKSCFEESCELQNKSAVLAPLPNGFEPKSCMIDGVGFSVT